MSSNNKGFTIIELIVATAVFSVLMLGASATIIEISRLYYKGTTLTQTQTAAQNLLEEISRPIQYEKASIVNGPDRTITAGTNNHTIKSICIGGVRYTYAVGLRAKNVNYDGEHIRHSVWRDKVTSPQVCADSSLDADLGSVNPGGGTDGVDMISDKIRLVNLEINEVSGKPNLWQINLSVLYGDRDLLLPTASAPSDPAVLPTECAGGVAGSQWCAHSSFETFVYKRLNGSGN